MIRMEKRWRWWSVWTMIRTIMVWGILFGVTKMAGADWAVNFT